MRIKCDAMNKLLRIGRSLLNLLIEPMFNYSAVQVIVEWITANAQRSPDFFRDIMNSVLALRGLVLPTGGLGMTEIWSVMAPPGLSPLQGSNLTQSPVNTSRDGEQNAGTPLAYVGLVIQLTALETIKWQLPILTERYLFLPL
jgi:hypothetical protein